MLGRDMKDYDVLYFPAQDEIYLVAYVDNQKHGYVAIYNGEQFFNSGLELDHAVIKIGEL